MSSEESYLAIIRYLTDEREPYAPGTHGNTKRKIRKAAACYVVRDGTLFYQRRSRGGRSGDDFTELEVVLRDPRRKDLIEEAHTTGGTGEHLNQQLTWENISQKYWWRGILKHVKDHIRECVQCRRVGDEGSMGRPGRRRRVAAVHVSDEDADEDEDVDDDELDFIGPSSTSKTTSKTSELVFVDSKGEVRQFLNKHSQTMLDKLNQQRQNNQFCDITLLIEGEEFRAHKAVLAACSDYFNQLFVEKGAVSTHEAVVDLSGFTKASFLPLLDFAYTSTLTFNFCVMAELATLAKHLLMAEVLQICESVHKQVEDQQLMVYQRGDTHTVVSSQPAPQEGFTEDSTSAYAMVTIQGDGQTAVVTHAAVPVSADESLAVVSHPTGMTYVAQPVVAVAVEAAEGESGQAVPVTLVTDGGQAGPGESITVISRSAEGQEEEETMTVVTHSGQAGESESLAVVSAMLAMEQQSQEGPVVDEAVGFITKVTDAEEDKEATLSEAPVPVKQEPTSPPQTQQPQPQATPEKRKRGRPRKREVEVVDLMEPVDEDDMSPPEGPPAAEESTGEQQESDDPNKRRLRQRSIALGGYARLHMGLEGEEGEKKGPPRQGASAMAAATTPPKVGPKPWKRGRPSKRSLESEAEELARTEAEEAGGAAEAGATGAEPITEEVGAKEPKAEAEMSAEAETDNAVGGEEHVCSDCGLSFERRYALIMHTLKHEKARGYKCSLCSKEFQYAASLRAHLARHKQQSRPVIAKPAAVEQQIPAGEKAADGGGGGDASSDAAGATAAAVASITKRAFVCDICGKTLPKLYSLRIHMLNHTGVRPHACKVCGKTFAHKHSLKMHRALHDVSKQFKCVYCSKSFVSKRSMEEHTSLHTGESKYLCNTCGATFHRGSALSKHLKKHQPRPEVRPYNCAHCDKSFYEAKDLQQHMNKHMGLKPFQCQVCGKSYSWKKDWYSHVKSHTVAEPYKCNVCGKEFFEKALFRRHVKKATHGKKGRVKQNLERECEHCGRKFTQLREYRRHINNHQGVKPFECLTCGVAWADARSLKRHVRTHTGERPYVCPLCQEAHIDARTLRKHMAKYHGENLPLKIMLEKDTLQFHNQGTQVEHAVSILASDLPPELRPALPSEPSEEIETVLITEETVEAVEAVQAAAAAAGEVGVDGVATLSDQSIMQVVNYVLAQQACMVPGGHGDKTGEEEGEETTTTTEVIQTMEVEVAHVATDTTEVITTMEVVE